MAQPGRVHPKGAALLGHSSPVNSKAFSLLKSRRLSAQAAGPRAALQGLPLQLSEEKGEASHKVHVCAMHTPLCATPCFEEYAHSKELLKKTATHKSI